MSVFRSGLGLGICCLSLTMFPIPAVAQTATSDNLLHMLLGSPGNWKVNASIRARVDGIEGQFRPSPAAASDAMLSLRSTLFVEYHAQPVRIGAELFDSRAYFQKRNSSAGTAEVNALELGQAYVAFDLGPVSGKGSRASITAGRFTQDIGSRRLVARNQFRNTINAFTGVRMEWQGAGQDRMTLFWTMPQYRLPDTVQDIRDNKVRWDRESSVLQFFGGSFTKAHVNGGTLEGYAYGLAERDSPALATRNRHLFTIGSRFARAPKKGRFDYDVEGAYQMGRTRASTLATDRRDLDVSAYFMHAELGRTFTAPWSPRLALQYDLASGDGPGGRYTRFDTLFGSRRGEFGPTSLYGAVQRSNLNSPSVRLDFAPNARWDLNFAWRGLWLQNATDSFAATSVRDVSGRSGKFAGHQFEFRARHWFVPKIARLDCGVMYLLKGRVLKDAPNAPDTGDTRYAYADLTFTL